MLHTKTQNSKVKLQGKLRLKRSNSDSTDNNPSSDTNIISENETRNQESCSNQSCHKEIVKSNSDDNEEDSLADFKSPKQEIIRKPNLNKYRIETDKAKKKIVKSKSKSTVKSRKSDVNQPTIKSSLLKPQTSNQNQVEAVPCPVCLKPFKDDVTCTNHMKSCAAKNNVSIKQLLEAKQLQDRQAEERKAMGLLAGPVIPEKKKTFRSKNFTTGDDPQLQLVLAMSESLYEAQKMVELEEAAFLAGVPSECIKDMNDEERRKTLQSFGFTTNKPVADVPANKQRKKKLLAPTILQTRSKEDKDRVLTERIACILTGDDALTQGQVKTEITSENKSPTVIRSRLLRRIEQTENKLWDRSRLTKQSCNFYVKELKSHFLKAPQPPVELETRDFITGDDDEQNVNLSNASIVYEPMDLDIIINQEFDQNKSSCTVMSGDMSESKSDKLESEFVKSVTNSWKEALNDSSASDVIIFVKNNKRVYAHKLVFHVQCSNILLSTEANDTGIDPRIGTKISWLEKDQVSALAFLEFIYSGTISKYVYIFDQKELVQQVEQLARFYKKQDLFTYIRNKQSELKYRQNNSKLPENTQKSTENNQFKSHEVTPNLAQNSSSNLDSSSNIVLREEEASKNLLTKHLIDRRITASPDLFDSEDDSLHFNETLSRKSNIKSVNNSDSNVSAKNASGDNDNKEEINYPQGSDEAEHFNSQNTIVNLSRSVSPLENIHEAITPPVGRSVREDDAAEENSIYINREFAEAVTPKCQSPETIADIKQEIIKSERDDICNAVTPEHDPPEELNYSVTQKKAVYTPMETGDVALQRGIDESIYTAVTPPRVEEEPAPITNDNVAKIKSELTLFIEKVQRRNAKDILETDSETDTPENRARRRNPFLKKDQDDSYRYLQNNINQIYHKAISLLEEDVLADQKRQKNVENVEVDFDRIPQVAPATLCSKNEDAMDANLPKIKSITSFPPDTQLDFKMSFDSNSTFRSKSSKENTSLSNDEVEDVTIDETEISMYSKYKKSNKHDNSIAKYREQLNFQRKEDSVSNSVEPKPIAEQDSNDSKLSKTFVDAASRNVTVRKPKPKIIGDVTLVSDSEEEQTPLRTFLREKSRNKIFKNVSATNVDKTDGKIETPPHISNIENDSTFPLELVSESLEPGKNSKVFNSTVLKKDTGSKVIDLSVDSDEGDIHDDSTFPNELAAESDNSLKIQKSHMKELETSVNKQKELEIAEKKSEDIDAEISKILQSSQDYPSTDEDLDRNVEKTGEKYEEDNTKNTRDRSFSSERKLVVLSPVSIVSSPEVCEVIKDESQQSKSSNNYLQQSQRSLALEENEDLALIDWNMKTPPKETLRNQKSLQRSFTASLSHRKLSFDDPQNHTNAAALDGQSNILEPKVDDVSKLISSPILSQNRRSSQVCRVKSQKAKSSQRKKSQSPECNSEDVRKLRTKSLSTSPFSKKANEADKHTLQRSLSFVTPEQNKKRSNREEVMTPPVNYSLLDTPSLKEELKKFGLKPQSRNRAKALLTHIYKETHSQKSASQKRTSSTNSSSEEDEPPTKKPHVKKTSKKSDSKNENDPKAETSSGKCSVIAEEMDFDDPDVASIFQTPVSIKDAFFKLIKTNRELYNKVLTYEPLPLESVHSVLKQNGIKCKINNLMDFLDEQCITFQVQTNKGDRTKKKKTSKT